jgi:mRNA deadenylase 3'-5' endonuclease subunit Ccr4
MDYVIIVLGIIIIWKFRNVLTDSADMAEDEFVVVKRGQQIRLQKERIKQTKQLVDVMDQPVMSDKEFNEFFTKMRIGEDA